MDECSVGHEGDVINHSTQFVSTNAQKRHQEAVELCSASELPLHALEPRSTLAFSPISRQPARQHVPFRLHPPPETSWARPLARPVLAWQPGYRGEGCQP